MRTIHLHLHDALVRGSIGFSSMYISGEVASYEQQESSTAVREIGNLNFHRMKFHSIGAYHVFVRAHEPK